MTRHNRGGRILLILALALILGAGSAMADRVLIKAKKPYDRLVQQIEELGGTVTFQYKYVNGIAAEIPEGAMKEVRSLLAPGALRKDLLVDQPAVARDRDGAPKLEESQYLSAQGMDAEELVRLAVDNPNSYLVNLGRMNIEGIHGDGYLGDDVVVAVIDSGYKPGYPHIDLDGSVIGGEDFVGDGLGWSNAANGGHGTFVAGMISADVLFAFGPPVYDSVLKFCPECIVDVGGTDYIPIVGSAPLSDLYAVRVFGPSGGAPESRIIAAMEQVLQIRENYDNGDPVVQNPDGSYDSLHIEVCNMSLGGPTLYAGRDFEDELTQAFLEKDIVLVVSASNAGPSGTTGGSPGTGFGSLTVGASSFAANEQIVADLFFAPGLGEYWRPTDHTQMASFSSRGPTADGRIDPDIVSSGDWNFGQGFSPPPSFVNWASGTSFSAPSVAGVAAVLLERFPTATARQVRNALLMGADPDLLGDNSTPLDQGYGSVDAQAAYDLLEAGTVPDVPGMIGGDNVNVRVNINEGAGVKTHTGLVTRSVTGLMPGERFETYYKVTPNTESVVVTLFNVVPGADQNLFFGDDIYFSIHSSKTSGIGEGDYFVQTFSVGGTYVISNPEQGLMRITLNGDWTNASPIDASVQIYSISAGTPGLTDQGKIADGESVSVPFTVPVDATNLAVTLHWKDDWSRYPTSDLDLILIDPTATWIWDGATLNSPERVEIPAPMVGDWEALVDGYTIPAGVNRYVLAIEID